MHYTILLCLSLMVAGCSSDRQPSGKLEFIRDQFMTIENSGREFAIMYRTRDISKMEMTEDAEIEGYSLYGDYILKNGKVSITTTDGITFVFPDDIRKVRNNGIPKVIYIQ